METDTQKREFTWHGLLFETVCEYAYLGGGAIYCGATVVANDDLEIDERHSFIKSVKCLTDDPVVIFNSWTGDWSHESGLYDAIRKATGLDVCDTDTSLDIRGLNNEIQRI